MSFRPLGNRVLVKPLPKETETEGGIIIPDTVTADRPMKGVVKATGEEIKEEIIKSGDTVLYAIGAGLPIKVEDEECLLMFKDDCFAVI